MFAIRLTTIIAMVVLSACGTAGSAGSGQAGAPARVAETRPIGWDMLDASVGPNATADVFVAASWCDGAGICVSRD